MSAIGMIMMITTKQNDIKDYNREYFTHKHERFFSLWALYTLWHLPFVALQWLSFSVEPLLR